MKRIKVLVIKELKQIRRDRTLFGILIIAPLIQLTIMGFAVTTDLRQISLAVRDQDRSYQSREYVRTVASSGYFQTTMLTGAEGGDGDLLVEGRAGLLLVIPRGFGQKLVGGRPSQVQVLVDGADSNFAVQGLNYLQKATRLYSQRLVQVVADELARRGVRLPAVVSETRAWYNPELLSRFFTVPALMGLLLMVTTMVVSSMALVKEREEGTMEQVLVTPLRSSEVIAGKLLPFVVIGFIEVTLALAVIFLVFRVPLRGSLLLLYLCSGLFLLTTLGLGTFVSTLVKTQQQAMMLAAFFVMMPFVLLSGFIFPVENMPVPIRWIAHMIPLKYYLIIVRGIFLKGTGWAELWPDAAILLVWGVGILSLAVMKFHKRLD
ncbi:MAG: ABC transporter permease [Verrucomicrobiota bacterium]